MTIQSGTHAIESMQLEERRYPPPQEFAKSANAQPDIYDRPFEDFWKEEALNRVSWFKPFEQVLEWKLPYSKWFLGGKLNACYNCVDRHVEAGRGDKVAYFWEGEPLDQKRTLTFKDLQAEVVRFANGLKKLGVKKGTPVGTRRGYSPRIDRLSGGFTSVNLTLALVWPRLSMPHPAARALRTQSVWPNDRMYRLLPTVNGETGVVRISPVRRPGTEIR